MTSPTEGTPFQKLLADEVARTSLTNVAEMTGVSRTSIENIVKSRNKGWPEVETFIALARAFRLPMWRLMEMAGVKLNLPNAPSDRAVRLVQLAERRPALVQLIDILLTATTKETEAILLATRVVRASKRE